MSLLAAKAETSRLLASAEVAAQNALALRRLTQLTEPA